MSSQTWRWVEPNGQQRSVRFDELRSALASGLIPPNTPVWRPGWSEWQPAHEVPELTTSALAAANGVVPNIPPPPLAIVAVQHAFEAKAGGVHAPSVNEDPPPPPKWVPAPTKKGSLAPRPPSVEPPPDLGSSRSVATQIGGPALAPPRAPSVRPAAPPIQSLPTAIGLPPPPQIAALAKAKTKTSRPPPPLPPTMSAPPAIEPFAPPAEESIEELSASMLVDESNDALPSSGELPTKRSLGAPDDDEVSIPGIGDRKSKVRDLLADLKSDLQEIRARRPPKNKALVAGAAVAALSVVILLLVLVVGAFSGGSSEASAPASASASGAKTHPPPSASAEPESPSAAAATPAAAPTKDDTKPTVELGDCTVSAEARSIAPKAVIASGIEAAAGQTSLALGFASAARDAVGVALDPGTLAPTSTVRVRATGDIRRVVPFFSGGKIVVVPDADKHGDKLSNRRFVATANPVDVGVTDGAIVWAPHGKESFAKLFSLDGDGAVEALRVIPLPASRGIALAFRRNGAIFVGVATGDGVLNPEGGLSRIEGSGQVGSPAIAVSGDNVVVAWADRADKDGPWGVRWTKRSISGAINEPRALALPEGGPGTQAISPAVASLGHGRFLLAWTEGAVGNHQVRALTFGADGAPSGSPLTISADGVNAGQPQAVVAADGRGVVAFLAAKGKATELMATSISCPAR